ncbi:MAG: 3-oxoacyl-ACP reductase FabG [Candidatus Aceula meridiana]|nr:3-oxoacyl-ACP reductase FabG [Candidatus Aceula meridiana]
MPFNDKVVIVTGGSRGIGKAIVEAFVQSKAKVYFTYNKNDEAAKALKDSTGAIPVKCSQTDNEGIEKTVDAICQDNKKIDILVNNAGITSDQFLMMMPFEQWEKVINVNLNGAYRWAKAVSRTMMTAQQGAIINVSSIAGLVGTPGQTNYAASKGGLLAFTRSLAAELGAKGIRVNAVVPGFIDTDMTAVMPRQIKRQNLERILLKRFGTPQEVAQIVLFLSSGKASYIVGQAIVVDGGLSSTAI